MAFSPYIRKLLVAAMVLALSPLSAIAHPISYFGLGITSRRFTPIDGMGPRTVNHGLRGLRKNSWK